MNKKTCISGLVLLAALAVAAFVAYSAGLWRFNYLSLREYPVQGIDVSHHQGEIDWSAVPKERFGFVYIKATEGGDHVDELFRKNWYAARAAGLMTGAYHFFTLCKDGPDQAKNFIEAVPKMDDALQPAIDLEFAGNCGERPAKEDFLRQLRAFVIATGQHYNAPPIIYTTPAFYKKYLEGTEFADAPLWVRGIFGKPDDKLFPHWALWQYADNARVPGIEGPVDLNTGAP